MPYFVKNTLFMCLFFFMLPCSVFVVSLHLERNKKVLQLSFTYCVSLNDLLLFVRSFFGSVTTWWQKAGEFCLQVLGSSWKKKKKERKLTCACECVLRWGTWSFVKSAPSLSGWRGASAEDDASQCISNGPLPHIKTTTQCAHVIRQRLFSSCCVCVCTREGESHRDKKEGK